MTLDTHKPVHILSGFLGSGKTTLLNKLLQQPGFENTLVIVNEFGEIPIDHHIIESSAETIVELSNGCLCCSIRGDLVDTLTSVGDYKFDRVIIETTGIADPLPIHQALMLQPVLARGLRAGSIISVFDPLSGPSTIQLHDEAARQLTLADIIYISMSDKCASIDQPSKTVSLINTAAEIFDKPEDICVTFLDTMKPKAKSVHNANHSGEYIASTLHSTKPQPVSAMIGFLHHLASICGPSLLRVKGFANVEERSGPLLLQMSGQILHDPVTVAHWPDGKAHTQLTVIAKDLDPAVIQSAYNSFIGKMEIDTPDREALMHNPLSIPGM